MKRRDDETYRVAINDYLNPRKSESSGDGNEEIWDAIVREDNRKNKTDDKYSVKKLTHFEFFGMIVFNILLFLAILGALTLVVLNFYARGGVSFGNGGIAGVGFVVGISVIFFIINKFYPDFPWNIRRPRL